MDRWGQLKPRRFKQRECGQYLGNGYLRVAVHHPGKGRRHPAYVHRLMALAFVDGYAPGLHVNHINGNKTDNRPENLEWVPAERNTRHQWKTSLVKPQPRKLTWRKVEAIRRALRKGVATTTIAIIADVSHTTIMKIRDGESWNSIYGKNVLLPEGGALSDK